MVARYDRDDATYRVRCRDVVGALPPFFVYRQLANILRETKYDCSSKMTSKENIEWRGVVA